MRRENNAYPLYYVPASSSTGPSAPAPASPSSVRYHFPHPLLSPLGSVLSAHPAA
ncbi:hypothetical protein TRAPUB_5505 [Trametes pubescens]|uniref:Uncharacterized protein n=1 Tax=Trametes pubescens TaxID=154538 RepID=A0A1M2W746_TRAPU|nr:hypothetical protein TRAPUB_5505 [Trametes pubescens]